MRNIPMTLLSVLLIISITNAYHILVVFPFPGKSHGILGEGHVKRLLEGGHEVTLITPFPSKKNIPKLHEIIVSETLEDIPMDKLNIEAILENTGASVNPSDILNIMINVANHTFYNPDVQILLRDRTKKFDAVIVEWLFSEILAGFAAVFEAPLIMFTSTEPHSVSLKLIDEYTNPAYVPSIFSASVPPFSFVERLKELAYQVFTVVLKEFVMESRENEFYDKTFGKLITEQGRKPIPFMELIYSSAIMLGNSHVSLGGAMRLPQSYKPIAGYHIDPVVKPLPEDLQKYMDSAKNGVIYFSLGSNLKSKELPDSIKQGLLKTFGALKYNVIWKFEELLPNLPSNVRIIQWAPQPSILAHPNCILFITHGGLLSTTETVHYGVPIIGIPVFGDQFINVDRAVAKGFAYKVPLTYRLADELKAGIEEILGNPSYAKRAKELSFIYHDRPASPGKELVHWVEHVIKTGGAPHLRSPALLVPWYQKMYLDLLAIVLIALYLLKLVIKKLCCRSQSKIQQKKKQN